MKNILKIIVGLLFVTTTFAQKGFPVKVDTSGNYSKRISELNGSKIIKDGGRVKVNESLDQIVALEGWNSPGLTTTSMAATVQGTEYTLLSTQFIPGKRM